MHATCTCMFSVSQTDIFPCSYLDWLHDLNTYECMCAMWSCIVITHDVKRFKFLVDYTFKCYNNILTLGACARAVCPCVLILSVAMLAATYIIYYIKMRRCHGVLYGIFQIHFCWKCFVQMFWHHLLTVAAFLASWQVLDRQMRQHWLLFNIKRV